MPTVNSPRFGVLSEWLSLLEDDTNFRPEMGEGLESWSPQRTLLFDIATVLGAYDPSRHHLFHQEEDEEEDKEAADEDQGYAMGALLPNGQMHLWHSPLPSPCKRRTEPAPIPLSITNDPLEVRRQIGINVTLALVSHRITPYFVIWYDQAHRCDIDCILNMVLL